MAVESPGQCGVISKPAWIRDRVEIQAEFRIGRIGIPEAVCPAEVGQSAIDSHTGAGSDQKRVRLRNHLGRPAGGFSFSIAHDMGSASAYRRPRTLPLRTP